MPVTLDVITRKKLILVRQIYQRAVLQAEAQHSYVDRILSLIGFDLSNETLLKAVVGAVDPRQTPSTDFQGIVRQADSLLAANGLPALSHKVQIQHVRTLRNDAQHKARYPNDTDLNDCRTYTRDFLKQTILDVWGERFESLSLVDVIQDVRVKTFLHDAETELANGDYRKAVVKAIAAFDWTMGKVTDSIVGKVPYYTKAISVEDSFGRERNSTEMFEAFENMRGVLMRSVVGMSFPGYLRFKQITRSVALLSFAESGIYQAVFKGHKPDLGEAEYIIEFATNSIIQIESLVGDIEKPFEL
jgi:hypothetical protein